MKRVPRRALQRQEQPQANSRAPFFSSDKGDIRRAESAPFFQAEAKAGEKEEKPETVSKAESEEQKDSVRKKGGEDEKKEQLPVMRQAEPGEEKKPQANPQA
ncbi:MAG: hypothetical protein HGB22_00260 [Chlorobiaceae bacterium]|nr:hypothetical protein [Chlorobiaceae bacterium]